MDIKKINELLKMVEKTSFTHFEYEDEKSKIVLKKEQLNTITTMPIAATVPLEPVAVAVADDSDIIKAPLVGTIYLSSSPEENPFAEAGKEVKAGDTVCLIEAMKMFNEIKAPSDCIISEILVSDGDMAEFGTPLFRIEKNND